MAGFMSAFETGVPEAYVVANSLVNRRDKMRCYSGARTSLASPGHDPSWSDENAVLQVGIEGSALVVLSVFSKSQSAITEDIFLGQTTVDLTAYPQLYSGDAEPLVLEFETQLGHAAHPVLGPDDNEMHLVDHNCTGMLSFQLSIPNPTKNLYGEFYDLKVNSSGYHDSAGEKQPMVLYKDVLYLYNNKCQGNLEYILDLRKVQAVKEMPLPMVSHDIPMDGIILSSEEIEKRFAHIIDWNRADGDLIKEKWKTRLTEFIK